MRIIIFLVTISTILGMKSFAQTQADMNIQAYKMYEVADKDLNKAYKELMSILNSEQKQLLITAQKDWIKFRDSHCKFDAEQFNMGSIQPLIRSTCLTNKTRSRTEDLKESYKSRSL